MNEEACEDRGNVSNIQRFSIQDGPGIRTTVFLQGCPLRCPWCSNPESQLGTPAVLLRIATCIRCGRCQEACPEDAIVATAAGITIDRDRCTSCLACATACPSKALEASGRNLSVGEVLAVVVRDKGYYQHSGGGLTLSGGEPLMQWPFAAGIFREAKRHAFHTALDTTGYADWAALAAVLPYTDLILFDLKHADPVRHQAATGVTNHSILGNLQRILGETPVEVWIRVAAIPGFNTSEEDISAIVEIVQKLPRPPAKLSLLPFHKLAAGKYHAMGRSYASEDVALLSDAEIARLKIALELTGVPVTVGA
jgi:pyruvate formate lyase activating enzyme